MKVKRYKLISFTNRGGACDSKMVPYDDGDWVEYADLEYEGLVGSRFALLEAMARLESELEAQGVKMTIKLEKIEDG